MQPNVAGRTAHSSGRPRAPVPAPGPFMVARATLEPLIGDKVMQGHHAFNNTTLEERLVDLIHRVRADVETLPPCRKRDELVQRLREIETGVEFNG